MGDIKLYPVIGSDIGSLGGVSVGKGGRKLLSRIAELRDQSAMPVLWLFS